MIPGSILIIDDDADDQFLFKEALKKIDTSIIVISAFNGVEGLAVLKSSGKLPDLVFLDLNMPLMNGIECLTKIKGDSRLQKIPVIIYSTSNNITEMETTRNLGASAYLSKSTEFKYLVSRLSTAFAIDFSVSSASKSWDEFTLAK